MGLYILLGRRLFGMIKRFIFRFFRRAVLSLIVLLFAGDVCFFEGGICLYVHGVV